MPQVIDELVTILGFDMDSRAGSVLDKFNKGIDSVADYAKTASIAMAAVSASIAFFTVQANKASDEIEKLGRVTGISTDTLQEMSFAMEQVGGSAATMNSDLESLFLSMNSPIPGEFNQGLFMLGISTKKASGELKTVDDVLLDIADKMQGMSKQKAMQWGQKIGISKDTIMLLQEGRQEIERLRKQAEQVPVIIDPESLKNAREFNRQISLLSRVVGFFGQTIASAAGPAIKDLVTDLMSWIKQNDKLIESGLVAFIEGTIDGFVKFADIIDIILVRIGELIPGIDGFKTSLTGAEIVSALVLTTLMAMAIPLGILAFEFLLVAAAVVAAGLAYEDFIVWMQGGDSVIGELIKSITKLWETFSQKFPAMADFLGEFWDVLKSFGGWVKDSFFWVLDKLIWLLGLVAKGWGLIAELAEKGFKKLGFGDDEDVLKPAIKDIIKTVKLTVIPAVEEASETIEPIKKTIVYALEESRDWFFGKIRSIIEPVQAPIEKTIEMVQAPIEKTIEMVQAPIEKTLEMVQAPIEKTLEMVQAPIEKTLEPIQAPIEKTIEMVQAPIEKTLEMVQAPIEKTLEMVQAPIEKTIEMVQAPIEKTLEMVQAPIDIAKEKMDTFTMVHEMGDPIAFTLQLRIIGDIMSKKVNELLAHVVEKAEEFNREHKINNNIETINHPIASIGNNSTNISKQNITNSTDVTIKITGNNAPAIASEVSSKMKVVLQQIYPGGLAPAVQ